MGKGIKLRKNKKGIAADMIYGAVMLFALAFVLIIGYVVYTNMMPELRNSALNTSAETIAALESGQDIIDTFDYLWVGILVAIILGIALTSMFVKVHPAFYFVLIIVLAITILLSSIFSNMYAEISSTTEINATSAFPMQNYAFSQFPLVMLIVGIIGIIILFSKSRASAGAGFQ